MKKLFFDTETSGFPKGNISANHHDQAWIIQIGLILEVDNKIQSQSCFLIRADGRVVHPGAERVHKISAEVADNVGIPEYLIAANIKYYLSQAEILIGHNISFDIKMVEFILARNKDYYEIEVLKKLPIICTMKSSIELCKIPGKYKYKWPKLTELYHFLFQEEFPAHDALEDIRATYRCYKELIKRGVIS